MTTKQLIANVSLALAALWVLVLFAQPRDMTEMLTDDQSALFQPAKAFEKNPFARFYNFMM